MVNLNRLTIPYIKKLAKECDITLERGRKADLINQIEAADIPEERLESLIEKFLKEKNKKKIKRKKKQLDIIDLEERIENLEEQVKYLTSIISDDTKTKRNLFSEESIEEEKVKIKERIQTIKSPSNDTSSIKEFIKSVIPPGESITIDDLFKVEQLQDIPLMNIENAISEMIESNILKADTGNKTQKIQGKIGLLKRT